MIFCEYCFRDPEIMGMIHNHPSKQIGTCPVCRHKEAHLYDTDKDSDLTPYFTDFLEIYTGEGNLPQAYPVEEKRALIDDIAERWNIFSNIGRTNIHHILAAVCPERADLFDARVGISKLCDVDYIKEHTLLRGHGWDEFAGDLKTKNRYHSKLINLCVLEKYCEFIRTRLPKGASWYRARISDEAGFKKNQMGAPPTENSTDGRANARGIQCLYLADTAETAMHEVRAGAFDYVSVAEFKLQKDIGVVNLAEIANISPFKSSTNCLDYAVNKSYFSKLDEEMSKVLRRNDSTIDYVPTQYITDFIRSLENNGSPRYSGIEYNSTTHKGGHNLAIFDSCLFKCVDVKVYEIEEFQYRYTLKGR